MRAWFDEDTDALLLCALTLVRTLLCFSDWYLLWNFWSMSEGGFLAIPVSIPSRYVSLCVVVRLVVCTCRNPLGTRPSIYETRRT